MPGRRSRQGCEECRNRRRKCDEIKPTCGQCSTFRRSCHYKLKLVWGGRKFKKSCFGTCLRSPETSAKPIYADDGGFVYGTKALQEAPPPSFTLIPQYLPNGVPLSQRYRKLLDYFAKDVLAALSCHPSIHEDLCRGLVPAMLESPHLLSASLALSAAGFMSRGLSDIDGIETFRIMEHLQSSGLPLLRTALEKGVMDEILLATCLIWCLADVFASQQGVTSWRIHLQGFAAILGSKQTYEQFVTKPGAAQSAMRHLYQLYLSLQTLPYLPGLPSLSLPDQLTLVNAPATLLDSDSTPNTKIDGFLGYSEELLDVLQQINRIPGPDGDSQLYTRFEADVLLGKVKGMINRDAQAPPDIAISSLSPESGREFSLCHKIFQQATLIHLYRKLYDMPSGSQPIRSAVNEINEMVSNMTQGQPCNTWVAMAMPIFTVGCEAFDRQQQDFILDKVHKLESCLGSLHVRIVRQALEDIWNLRRDSGDVNGELCASQLLSKSTSLRQP